MKNPLIESFESLLVLRIFFFHGEVYIRTYLPRVYGMSDVAIFNIFH